MRWTGGIALLALLAGCAHGTGTREYWRGLSTGTVGECAPVEFDVTVLEGRLEGWATSRLPQGPVTWEVQGTVAPDDQVSVETTTVDPRIGARRVSWRGVWKRLEIALTQTAPGVCDPPRTARLRRP
jgi:hypothetical protein